MLKALAQEEFGAGGAEDGDAAQAAIAAGISTGLGAMIPVIPFIFTHGTLGIGISAGVSLIAHFLVGAAKSLVTLRTWWAAGLEMTLAGVIVGGATYLLLPQAHQSAGLAAILLNPWRHFDALRFTQVSRNGDSEVCSSRV